MTAHQIEIAVAASVVLFLGAAILRRRSSGVPHAAIVYARDWDGDLGCVGPAEHVKIGLIPVTSKKGKTTIRPCIDVGPIWYDRLGNARRNGKLQPFEKGRGKIK